MCAAAALIRMQTRLSLLLIAALPPLIWALAPSWVAGNLFYSTGYPRIRGSVSQAAALEVNEYLGVFSFSRKL